MPRKRHRIVGIVMLLPFLAWAATAVFFLVRPAYEQAYEPLSVRSYPLLTVPAIASTTADWQETRYLRTILGEHLLVRTAEGWQHLHADTQQAFTFPDEEALRRLLTDAFQHNPLRYGELLHIEGNQATTSTGVDVQLYWDTLSISQQGRDTRLINQIYDIHYLRWTGIAWFDRVFGLLGLALLIYMTYSGARMAFARPTLSRRRTAAKAV